MKLLVVNGNTSKGVTRRIAEAARVCASPGTEIAAVTARFGADVVGTHTENAIAHHAVLVAISLDTAVEALREITPVPVLGMTRAALASACLLGDRFGLVVFGRSMVPVYAALVARLGLGERLCAIHPLEAPARALAGRADSLDGEVTRAALALCEDGAADVVVVAGALAAGMPVRIQHAVPVPVLEGVACGVVQAEALVRLRAQAPAPARRARAAFGTVTGVSEALARALRDPH